MLFDVDIVGAIDYGGTSSELMREFLFVFFFQAEDGIRDLVRSRGLGDVYKRQRQDQPCRTDGRIALQ